MTGITVVVVVLLVATAVGFWLRSREGRVRTSQPTPARHDERIAALREAGVAEGAVTVLHFSAPWCRPCVSVRRVVAAAVTDADSASTPTADREVDFDENPVLARAMGVMSLPTTFVVDSTGTERFRVSGVPSAADLSAAIAAAHTAH